MSPGSPSALRIVSVLPALLGTYGDGGNVVVLERRLAWRGIVVEVVPSGVRDPLPEDGDLYVLGGGEDRAQLAALSLLGGAGLSRVLARGVPVLAVCAGLQLLGETLEHPDGRRVPGLGLVDLSTTRLAVRAVGEVVARPGPGLGLGPVTGFVNHAGATRLGAGVQPFASVTTGPGNTGEGDPDEGMLAGCVVGTYLHGPVLARNPALADLLLTRATGAVLPPLVPGPEQRLHEQRLSAAAAPGRASRVGRARLSRHREPG